MSSEYGEFGEYVLKPLKIKAVQLTHDNFYRVMNWCGGSHWSPAPLREVQGLFVVQKSGNITCKFGDYLIKCVNGDFLVSREDVFVTTFDKCD